MNQAKKLKLCDLNDIDEPKSGWPRVPGSDLYAIERLVADHYDVFPIDSKRAFETALDENGAEYRAIHETYALSPDNTPETDDMNFQAIKANIPLGATVIWRRRPTIINEGGARSLTCRIGYFQKV